MPYYDVGLLEKFGGENWRDTRVWAITFPAPPIPARGTIYAVDSWASSTLDRGLSVLADSNNDVHPLGARLTDRGPAFVVAYKLGSILQASSSGLKADVVSIYCATISFAIANTECNGIRYANHSIIENVTPIHNSCHPGSHTAFPFAPNLTTLVQLGYALNRTNISDFTFADDKVAAGYFPEIDFATINGPVDKIFRYLRADHFGKQLNKEGEILIGNNIVSGRVRRQTIDVVAPNQRLFGAVKGEANTNEYIKAVDALQAVISI